VLPRDRGRRGGLPGAHRGHRPVRRPPGRRRLRRSAGREPLRADGGLVTDPTEDAYDFLVDQLDQIEAKKAWTKAATEPYGSLTTEAPATPAVRESLEQLQARARGAAHVLALFLGVPTDRVVRTAWDRWVAARTDQDPRRSA